jgi:hypothetical protein
MTGQNYSQITEPPQFFQTKAKKLLFIPAVPGRKRIAGDR